MVPSTAVGAFAVPRHSDLPEPPWEFRVVVFRSKFSGVGRHGCIWERSGKLRMKKCLRSAAGLLMLCADFIR
jgi:hypothetical protein